jgi:predicted nucleic acid-binding protein
MPVYFFDTSGIVKRYIHETGTAWVQSAADPAAGNLVYLASLAAVEVTSAVTRRQDALTAPVAAAVLAQFRKDMALEYRILEITAAVLSSAVTLAESHALRAYDAVQLAAAAELNSQRLANGLTPLILVSADRELNAAASLIGLGVADPNLHP